MNEMKCTAIESYDDLVSQMLESGVPTEVALVETRLCKKKKLKLQSQYIKTPEAAAKFGKKLFFNNAGLGFDKEYLFVVGTNNKMEITYVSLASIGTAGYTVVDPASIVRGLILSCSQQLILFHNHLSGDPSPSNNDRKVNERMGEVTKLLGLKLCDHIVIGENDRFYSFKQEGEL